MALSVTLLTSCGTSGAGGQTADQPIGGTRTYTYKVVNVYPHDPNAFTQGLIYLNGFLYEGTGLNGRSSIRKVKLETGAVLQEKDIPSQYFGEGLTDWRQQLIELTWQSGIGFVYQIATFDLTQTFNYTGEGWGLTHDSSRLIESDGTSALRFWSPETLQEVGRVTVTDNGKPVVNLNELEYINGEVWANVWQTDRIARIAPQTGHVNSWVDLSGLLSDEDRVTPVDVLNGIAYDAQQSRIFVTGKLWPKLFEIKVIQTRSK